MEKKLPHLPKEIADLLAETPEVTENDLERLRKAGEEIDLDPSCRAELQKGLFINAIMQAMKEEDLNQSAVARNMKCSRQNLHRILQEEVGVNFTIETMDSVAMAVKRRVEVVVLKGNESVHVMRCISNAKAGVSLPPASEFKMFRPLPKTNYSTSSIGNVRGGKYRTTNLQSVLRMKPKPAEQAISQYAA